MVQVGNEITAGMIWPEGASGNWDSLAALIKAGVAGVKAVDSSINIVIHLDKGGNFGATRWWLDSALARGVVFDILGESCYTNYQGDSSDWQATFDSLVLNYPQYSFIIAEYSPNKRAANDVMFNLPNEKGLGAFIWEPLQYGEAVFTASGNNWSTNSLINLYPQMSKDYGNDTLPSNVRGTKSDPIRGRYCIVNSFAGTDNTMVTYTSPATTEVSLELYTIEGALLNFKKERAVTGLNRSALSFGGPKCAAGQYLVALKVQGEVLSMQGVVRLR